MTTIQRIVAYEILASGGYPTIEARVELSDGSVGIASVPYGASTGSQEASVLLDGDRERFGGKGMLRAAEIVNSVLAKQLVGKDAYNQREVDTLMIRNDGTPLKTNYGGNSILAVSMALARAGAVSKKMELFSYLEKIYGVSGSAQRLPRPMAVTIEGGKHADNSTDFQEYLLTCTHGESVMDNLQMMEEIYHAVGKVLKSEGLSTNVGNEGAFAPAGIGSNSAPLSLLAEAIENTQYKLGEDVWLSMDPAASEFYNDGMYHLKIEDRQLTSAELILFYEELAHDFPIYSIEDGLSEQDWEGWQNFYTQQSHKLKIIGDDLTVTNKNLLEKALSRKAINGILIKLNQAGSVTETIDTCMLAAAQGAVIVPSRRGGGETDDSFMIVLAVAGGGGFVNVGPTRGERVAKYNRLLQIERVLSKK